MTFTETANRVIELGAADRKITEEYLQEHLPPKQDKFIGRLASEYPPPPPPSRCLISLRELIGGLSVATQYMLVAVFYIGHHKRAGVPLLDEYENTTRTFPTSAASVDHILRKIHFPEHIATGLRLVAEDRFDIDTFMGSSDPRRN